MAYNQAPLKNIGDLRDKIVKRKLDKKFGVVEGADKFKQIEDFRSRATERNQPKVKTMETSFKTSIKPFEKETIKFDVPEKEVVSTKRKQESKLSKASKKIGSTALDIIAPLVPGLGRKRTFVSGAQQEGSNHVIGSGSGFNEKVDVPINPRTGNERFRFGEYQRFKRENYTPEQRAYNIKANVRNKGMLGTIASLTTFGSGFKHGEKNQKIVKDLIKKGVKKIKRIIN